MSLFLEFIGMRPAGGFDMIMADPPWETELRSGAGYTKAPEAHYQTMTTRAIMEMPVEVLAAKHAVLWLWFRGCMMQEGLDVARAWGFEVKTSGHWAKVGDSGKQAFGTGYLLRNAGEPWLIATRGTPKTSRDVRSVIIAPSREHSRKPDKAFSEAERLMPDARRLELFSRQERAGWTVWGNETAKFERAS